MAKWGKGDPRWIVEQRPDSHNVNNWHWTEKNATDWSKKELAKLLVGLKVEDQSVGSCCIKEIKSCEGDATLSNRKKKIISFYEFNIKAIWKGSLKGSDIIYEGELEIPNLSEENTADEIDVSVYFTKDHQKCDQLKELMRIQGTKLIRLKMGEYADSLRNNCGSTLQVPTVQESVNQATESSKTTINSDFKQHTTKLPSTKSNNQVGTKIFTKKLVMTVTFMAEVSDVYKSLVMKERVAAWSRSNIKSDAKAGEAFQLFDGFVSGVYTSLKENEKIVLQWRQKNWPDAHHSVVTISFQQSSSGAEIKLEQTGVPEGSVESTRSGWYDYYWKPIKMTFGFGFDINGIF